ncbi:hypothetical protein [Thalassospira xiamenensis]|uniref:Transcriptional regulator, XRE family n=1 Tax=Thalassospira xiamenensis TaxID=220697 RepID=A0A285U247_9PROT|nr:hypothetical protein [Thalassospira xiamenensis]SOC30412.1 transcriptional regulator, XRE family [Thalassospira xiamenensis]
MASNIQHLLSAPLKRSFRKMGANISLARKRRKFTIAMMLDRTGMAKQTYQKIEKGDPTVAIAYYALVFSVLGEKDPFGNILAPETDEVGLMLDVEKAPKRVRPPQKKGQVF